MGTKTDPPDERSFETVIGRLEAIVERMEAETVPLEELLVRYEEGINLVKICSEKLEAAERRIEIITRESSGKPKAVEFEPASNAENSQKPAPSAPEDVRLF